MARLAIREIMNILRTYQLASEDDMLRSISNVFYSTPSPHHQLIDFLFNDQHYVCVIDGANDSETKGNQGIVDKYLSHQKAKIISNPLDNSTSAMPYKAKSCYLFMIEDVRMRLDQFLASKYSDKSRTMWQKIIKRGDVSVNDEIVKSPKMMIMPSDNIQIAKLDLQPVSKQSFEIIYQDNNVIAINKPAGILTHSKGSFNDEFTVADFFKQYSNYHLDTNRPGIIHRLDRDTSGIIIGALNDETASTLQRQFSERKTKKTYYAIVQGRPKLDKAVIDLPISRNPKKPSQFKVSPNGKSAVTQYEVIDTTGSLSLIKLQPTTGRTHQLRVHMEYIGTPILGDRVYSKKPSSRMFLHAYSLEITIPTSDRKIFTAKLPEEYKEFFNDERYANLYQ